MTKATIRLAKVGGAYLGAAVLALETYNALTAPLELPSWMFWLVIIALAGGIPLVLLLAVRHTLGDPDIEADPWMSRAPRALVGLTLLIVFGGGGAVTYWVVLADDGVRAREDALHSPSVAVMPFESQSPDPDDSYFAEGLTDELTRVFTEVPGIRVMAGGSVAESKGSDEAAVEIARDLGVGTVLVGSVRKSNGRIRVTARLINTADGFNLWQDKFDRELIDVFDLQDELSAAIVTELSPTVTQSKAAPSFDWGTENAVAYDHYLRGRWLVGRGTAADTSSAVAAFRQALEEDPEFSTARSALEELGG